MSVRICIYKFVEEKLLLLKPKLNIDYMWMMSNTKGKAKADGIKTGI